MPRLTSIALITVLAVLMVFTVHPVSADFEEDPRGHRRGERKLPGRFPADMGLQGDSDGRNSRAPRC